VFVDRAPPLLPAQSEQAIFLRARINASSEAFFIGVGYVRAFVCGTGLLTASAPCLGLLQQYTAGATQLPLRPATRCDWYYLHKNFVPLILHHRITARIVNVSSSERASIRFEEKCAVYFQYGPAREIAVVDKSPLNFGGLLLPKPCLIPVALSNGTGAWEAIKADGKDHARRGRRLRAGLATFVWFDRSNRVRGGRSADYHGQRDHGHKLCAIQPR
jgi:hypothetical protein